MPDKDSAANPFSEFLKILENQKNELEKLTKPILESQKKAREMAEPVIEYQQKLFVESIELQKTLMENVMETTRRMMRIMSDSPMKYTGGGDFPGRQILDYMRTMQTIQENWMDQLRSTSTMFRDYIRKNTK